MSDKKEPGEIVMTEDEFWAAFRAAHLAGETSPELDVMAKALDRAEEQLAKKTKTVSGRIIDGEAKSLEALAKYFDITEHGGHYEIRCKTCRKGWGVTFQQVETFNPLGLFDHAFAHEENTDAK
jgi:hypothetical protein